MSQAQKLQQTFERQKAAYATEPFPDAVTRLSRLDALNHALVDNQQKFVASISEDFGRRSADETMLAELLPSVKGIQYARKNLKRWMKPSRRKVSVLFQPARARVEYQPKGVVGVIVPWNYPLYLAIGPLTAALAAGNRVMLKVSEHTPATSALFQKMIRETFPDDLVDVITGDADVAISFSELPFDHLLFTGSTEVGKHVMAAAAKNLTPVTLELGGKSPALISQTVNAREAAERIAFGKAVNAGQTCVAPDYVLCPENRADEITKALQEAFTTLFKSGLRNNPDYSHIINQRQYDRLHNVLQDALTKGAHAISCNPENEHFDDTRIIAPTLLRSVTPDMKVMQEEIFGPLLPVITYKELPQAIEFINHGTRPLALYYFGHNKNEQRTVLENTHSGGTCIKDSLLHVAQDDLPFGGIGHSGMGHYHGKEGFLTFSHARSILHKGKLNSAKLIYPPYRRKLLDKVYRWFIG